MKIIKDNNIKWSSDIAYVVGLITTDGCLSNDGRHIDFTSKDIQLLRTFKKCLGIKNKITSKKSSYTGRKDCSRIQFGNIIFYKWLLSIGLMRNKTKKMKGIKIPDKFFFDFLRGYLDGDGSIRRYQDPIYPNSLRIYISFASCNTDHLKWLRANIRRLLPVKGFFRKGARVRDLSFAKKESLILLTKMYPNSKIPCLKRKYNIIKDLI